MARSAEGGAAVSLAFHGPKPGCISDTCISDTYDVSPATADEGGADEEDAEGDGRGGCGGGGAAAGPVLAWCVASVAVLVNAVVRGVAGAGVGVGVGVVAVVLSRLKEALRRDASKLSDLRLPGAAVRWIVVDTDRCITNTSDVSPHAVRSIA